MKIRNYVAILGIIALATACKSNEQQQSDERVNVKISEYLYGVEYDDFDFNAGVEMFEKKGMPVQAAACSEVRKGDFVGRNLDWYINCDASAIVKVNGSESRYASIGVAGCNPIFSDSLAATGEYHDIYKLLPMFIVDGINEHGVYAGVNVMPTGETSMDESKWETGKWGNGAAFTNPGAEKTYCVSYLVRFVMDNAKSLAEAKQLIESINWYEPNNFPHPGESQAFHWLICDSVSSAVLEFVDNKPCFTETTDIKAPSLATIMTNFTNKIYADKQLVQNTGCGYERYDLLKASYADTEESFEGIQSLMKKVWYTKTYTIDTDDEGFWATEYAGPTLSAKLLYKNADRASNADFINVVNDLKTKYADKSNWHIPATDLWYSTHTSTYNLSTRTLQLMVHEGLDGQKEFYSVDFNSTFPKPLK